MKKKIKQIYNHRKWKYSLLNVKNSVLDFSGDNVKEYSPSKLNKAILEMGRGTPISPTKQTLNLNRH